MTYSSPPSLADLASALKSLLADERAAVSLLKHYANVERAEAEQAYRRADPINVSMAEAICQTAKVFPGSPFPLRDRISALRKMTVAAGCTEQEADTALRLAEKLAAKHAV
jgi:endonuclease V-like protein UPF0215 family